MEKRTSSDYFSTWYEKNKEELSRKRKERYQTDPAYREAALRNRAKQIERQRGLSPLNPIYSTTFSEAAEELGITLWRLRNWRTNNYFPEPYSYGKFLYFTDNQMQLLRNIKEFIGDKPRLTMEDKEKLGSIVNLIFANWIMED